MISIAVSVVARLSLDEIYPPKKLAFDYKLLTFYLLMYLADVINLSVTNFEYEVPSTFTLVLHIERLTNHMYCNLSTK